MNDEILTEIMSRLPPESLMQCKRINRHGCKLISELINNSKFVAKHLSNMKNSTFSPMFLLYKCNDSKRHEHLPMLALFNGNGDNGPFQAITEDIRSIPGGPQYHLLSGFYHCDGIICIADGAVIYLWNPAFKEVRFIRGPGSLDTTIGIGFGNDPGGGDYKIVAIRRRYEVRDSRPLAVVQVYSLRTGAWRAIEPIDCTSYLFGHVYCKGVCYWLTHQNVKHGKALAIFSFDMHREKFHYLPWPANLQVAKGYELRLAGRLMVLNDSVALVCYRDQILPRIMEMWLLDDCFDSCNGYKGTCSWTNYQTFGPFAGNPIPLEFWKSDELLLGSRDGRSLHTYNFRSRRLRKVATWESQIAYFVCSYVKSLVPVLRRPRERKSSGKFSEGIVMEIMSWLPPESLKQFKHVNQNWHALINHLINDWKFVAKHLCNTKNNISSPTSLLFSCWNLQMEPELKIEEHLSLLTLSNGEDDDNHIQSVIEVLPIIPGDENKSYWKFYHCNGIICLDDKVDIKLWNPALAEVKKIPKPHAVDPQKLLGMGFGSDPQACDYKIVVIGNPYEQLNLGVHCAEVYSLLAGIWKEIELPCECTMPLCSDVCCNGVCYWLMQRNEKGDKGVIFSFEMDNEKFHVLPLPDNLLEVTEVQMRLMVLNDSVTLLSYPHHEGLLQYIERWSMDDGLDGDKGYWTKSAISLGPLLDIHAPLLFWKNDELLVEYTDGRLQTYNLHSQKLRNVAVQWSDQICFLKCSYVKSLVSVVRRA